MKPNDYSVAAATLAYSALFYSQTPGINTLVFTIILIIIFLMSNKELLRQPQWWWATGLSLFSAVCVIIHNSALSIFANCCSLVLLSAFSSGRTNSALLSFAFGFFSLISSFVFVIIDAVNRNKQGESRSSRSSSWLGFLIVIFIAALFFALYRNSNPLFKANTSWINLDFISVRWFFFTLGGFLLVYGLLFHRGIGFFENLESRLSGDITNKSEEVSKKMETEKRSLILLFALLNLMLIAINAGDFNTLVMGRELPAGMRHSDFVHDGIGTLILSILFAIAIIMFFLRGQLNYIKGSSIFKNLILLWILQNVFMLISTTWRNQLYITEYTLTYKRIGVYVWLGLALIGLFITALKVHFNKSNWYLVRSNVAVWFTVLSLSSVMDWDLLIVRYNLSHKSIAEVDYNYLFNLSETVLPDMIGFCAIKLAQEAPIIPAKGTPDSLYRQPSYMYQLHEGIENYLSHQKSDWRSWSCRDQRILHSIYYH